MSVKKEVEYDVGKKGSGEEGKVMG